jgi:hypothetical protein
MKTGVEVVDLFTTSRVMLPGCLVKCHAPAGWAGILGPGDWSVILCPCFGLGHDLRSLISHLNCSGLVFIARTV